LVSQPLLPLGVGECVGLENDGRRELLGSDSSGGLESSWCGDSRRKLFDVGSEVWEGELERVMGRKSALV
jgi:hypothetical protein